MLKFLDLFGRYVFPVKFMFSEKATKIYEIFTVGLTLCSKCQIDEKDFVDFCGLHHGLYISGRLPIFCFPRGNSQMILG